MCYFDASAEFFGMTAFISACFMHNEHVSVVCRCGLICGIVIDLGWIYCLICLQVCFALFTVEWTSKILFSRQIKYCLFINCLIFCHTTLKYCLQSWLSMRHGVWQRWMQVGYENFSLMLFFTFYISWNWSFFLLYWLL